MTDSVFSAPFLVVAHPGHELRVHGWMERVRPVVCVLTDGSGSTGEGRIESTVELLANAGARQGPLFGAMSDREIYAAIMSRNVGRFSSIVDELVEAFANADADCVVGDAIEGYNPSHDVCRLVINAALRIYARTRGAVASYDFLLVGSPTEIPREVEESSITIRLDEHALDRKLAAARGYPALALEVDAAIQKHGVAPFAFECLRPSSMDDWAGWTRNEPPYYERYGEQKVAEGVYKTALRFREHVLPIAEGLREYSVRAG